MRRPSRLATLLGLFLLAGFGFPSDADAQRRGGGGGGGGARGGGTARPAPAGGGAVYRGTHVAVPRSSPPYSHYRPYYSRPYYRPYYYRPYYYGPYYSGYYPYYYSPWSFGLSLGVGWYGASYASLSYGYPYYPARYVVSTPAPAPYAVTTGAPDPYAASPAASNGTRDQGEFGTLSLRVMPFDATIVIDREAWDRPHGDDRFSIELTGGLHQVEIRKPGYTTYVRTIDVPRGQSLVLNVALSPAGAGGATVARTVPFRQ